MKNLYWVTVCALFIFAGTTFFATEGLSLTVVPGKNWKSTMWIGFIPKKNSPQIAAWVESADGNFVAALLVTERAGKKNWYGAPEGGRPESLPVWYHAVKGESGSSAGIDAATSATPSGNAALQTGSTSLVTGKEYRIRLEVNHSFDYNDAWSKKAKKGSAGFCGVNGQPSIVYEALFIAGSSGEVVLQFAGQGSVDGSSGAVTTGKEGLSTAVSIIESATVRIK